jgi:uncharacterized membrane protein
MTTSLDPLHAIESRFSHLKIDPTIAPAVATIALGVATGCRSMMGVAAVSRAAHSRARSRTGRADLDQPARTFASATAMRITAAAAAMELGGDKLPGAPNRTDPRPLIGRMICGAIVGTIVATLTKRPRGTYAALGAGAALAGAEVGLRARRALISATTPVAAGAIEDAIVMGIVSVGVAALRGDR